MFAITILLERKGKEMEVGHDEGEADRNLTIASSTALCHALSSPSVCLNFKPDLLLLLEVGGL